MRPLPAPGGFAAIHQTFRTEPRGKEPELKTITQYQPLIFGLMQMREHRKDARRAWSQALIVRMLPRLCLGAGLWIALDTGLQPWSLSFWTIFGPLFLASELALWEISGRNRKESEPEEIDDALTEEDFSASRGEEQVAPPRRLRSTALRQNLTAPTPAPRRLLLAARQLPRPSGTSSSSRQRHSGFVRQ
jgi:hypothetical protein